MKGLESKFGVVQLLATYSVCKSSRDFSALCSLHDVSLRNMTSNMH